MKPRSVDQLSNKLDNAQSWRKRELITFKLLVERSRPHQAEALRRAGIALLYAHWEGFVKEAGTFYVEFVTMQRMTHAELKPNFLALAIRTKLLLAQSSTKATVYNEVAAYFVERMGERVHYLSHSAVQTKSNLSAERLREIIATLGLDYGPFQVKEISVVEKLRHTRNNVAHGRYFDVDAIEFDRLFHDVVEMIDEYRNQIENAALLRLYKR